MQRTAILVLVLVWTVCLLAGGGLARSGETAGGDQLLVVNAAGDCAHPVQHYREDLAGLGYRVHEAVRPILARGDLNFVNLETPVTDRSPVLEKMYAFNAPAASLDEMVRAGFNLFSLANNHMADAGPGGIADTEAHLRRLDAARGPLHWAGAGSRRDAVHFRVPGHPQRIAFLALGNDAGVARFEEGAAVAAVRAAAKKADIVLVSVHKGVEYEHRPPAELVRGYRRLIEAGATVVLGHHPHVVQGIEAYQTGLIFYSLGNYSLASKTVRHRRTGAKLFGMLPTLSFRGSRPVAARITPLYVNNLEPLTLAGGKVLTPTPFKPQLARGPFADHILASIVQWSGEIPGNTTRFTRDGDALLVDLPAGAAAAPQSRSAAKRIASR